MDKCPVCGSNKHTHIRATGGEWVDLNIWAIGSVHPNVCLNCGTIYISERDRENIKKKEGIK